MVWRHRVLAVASRPADQRLGVPVTARAVRVTAALAAIEGVALTVLALFLAVKPAFTPPHSLTAAEALAVFTLFGGALCAGLGLAMALSKRWARTPILVLQLVALPIGATLAFQAGLVRYGAPILLLALATIGALARAESKGTSGH